MKDVVELHRNAMNLADQGLVERLKGNRDESLRLARDAFDLEKNAALLVAQEFTLEPTRSVLFRSAASLAIECGEFREAEKLIAMALTGDPPKEIARELRELWDTVNFRRHLKLEELDLWSDEFQFILEGDAVGPGFMRSSLFIDKVRNVEKIIKRTTERKKNLPFREKGPVKGENLFLYQSLPRAASYAINFMIASKKVDQGAQAVLSGSGLAEEVIDEVYVNLDLVNKNELETLSRRINNEPYYRNFVSLARLIAPDGEDIKTVTMSIIRQGEPRVLTISRKQTEISPTESSFIESTQPEMVVLEGILNYADARNVEKGIIKLVENGNITHNIKVLPGMMDDIVRPYFDYRVKVVIKKTKREKILETIEKIEES